VGHEALVGARRIDVRHSAAGAGTGSAELHRWAERVREYTLGTFPDPDGQEWIQIRSRDGRPLDEVVALPVKDPMHIARSLLLVTALEADELPTTGERPAAR
jgi:N-acylglucosamine 2-epimerase